MKKALRIIIAIYGIYQAASYLLFIPQLIQAVASGQHINAGIWVFMVFYAAVIYACWRLYNWLK